MTREDTPRPSATARRPGAAAAAPLRTERGLVALTPFQEEEHAAGNAASDARKEQSTPGEHGPSPDTARRSVSVTSSCEPPLGSQVQAGSTPPGGSQATGAAASGETVTGALTPLSGAAPADRRARGGTGGEVEGDPASGNAGRNSGSEGRVPTAGVRASGEPQGEVGSSAGGDAQTVTAAAGRFPSRHGGVGMGPENVAAGESQTRHGDDEPGVRPASPEPVRAAAERVSGTPSLAA